MHARTHTHLNPKPEGGRGSSLILILLTLILLPLILIPILLPLLMQEGVVQDSKDSPVEAVRECDSEFIKRIAGKDDHLEQMRDKQAMHVVDLSCPKVRRKVAMDSGDRSDPQLQALDALRASGLTYDNWQADVQEAENIHVHYPLFFDVHLEQMRDKQAMHSAAGWHGNTDSVGRIVVEDGLGRMVDAATAALAL